MSDPKDIVERGYDRIVDRFAEWQRAIEGSERLERLDDLLRRLPLRPTVLELGSGAGVRSTRILAERGRLTGVDLSSEQVKRARERLPEARFIHGDVMSVEFAPETFDAVVSFYVLNNLPREELGALFARIHGWLRPGGWLLASLPATDNPGWRGEWLGVEMFFSGYDAETTLGLARDAGLEVVEHSLETMLEPDWEDGRVGDTYCEVRWLWLLARRPAGQAVGRG
jgi:cyclopropane fatty-acyl-phospholipid synthase-like methyltransferase